MRRVFYDAYAFNQGIGVWNVSSVTDMEWMFFRAEAFNQDIGGWDVSSVTDMHWMLREMPTFSQDLCWNLNVNVDMSDILTDTTATVTGGPQYSEYSAQTQMCTCPASKSDITNYGQYGVCSGTNDDGANDDGANASNGDDDDVAVMTGSILAAVVVAAGLLYFCYRRKIMAKGQNGSKQERQKENEMPSVVNPMIPGSLDSDKNGDNSNQA